MQTGMTAYLVVSDPKARCNTDADPIPSLRQGIFLPETAFSADSVTVFV